MTAKNDPSTNALFQDVLLDDAAKLGIVRARFEGFDMSSFDELIAGYSSMKVLIYSSSTSIINRAAEGLERLEIVFGRPDILGDMASYLHFQELLLKELIEATRGKDFIKKKIESGAIKLYVVQDIISHVVFRSEDIHDTIAKLRRDVPDYLYGSGTKGNVIVVEADELQKFLGVSILPNKSRLGALARLLKGTPR